jgi:hypothetical protein
LIEAKEETVVMGDVSIAALDGLEDSVCLELLFADLSGGTRTPEAVASEEGTFALAAFFFLPALLEGGFLEETMMKEKNEKCIT